jgi:multiple sugar transport system ATP-binding protein
MAEIVFAGVTRHFPRTSRPAVDHLDLRVEDGEFLVLVGPSGCGKTTSLRMLAGLERVNDGRIFVDDRDVTAVPARARDIAMVFQSYALYPHMTAADNMGFALKLAHRPKPERIRRISDTAELLDLIELLGRKPAALSGGQRQRVAMGRAIVRQPKAFLMDEPLSNLDAKLRVQTRAHIAALQRRLGVTTVYVTHDQVEAMTMGDRVAVLCDGQLQQCDEPRVLYESPVNVFVAGFIGSPSMNLCPARVHEGHATIGSRRISLPETALAALAREGSEQVVVGIRPEALSIGRPESGIEVVVQVVEELGSDAYAYVSHASSGTHEVDLIARVDPKHPPAKGDRLSLIIDEDDVHLFSALSGDRLTQAAFASPRRVITSSAPTYDERTRHVLGT